MAVINLNTVEPYELKSRPAFGKVNPVAGAVCAFRDAIAASTLGSPDIVADGKLHRFDTSDDKPGKKSGWYILHMDNIPAGVFGSWKDDSETHTWSAHHSWEMTASQEEEHNRNVARMRAMRAAIRKQEADEAAATAREIWGKAVDASPDHPYLQTKGVPSFGLRQHKGALLVPLWGASGEMRGIQRIFPDGKKFFNAGVEKKGCCFWIPGDDSVVYICEGYSTGASLHMATGHAVVVAIDAGNLAPVTQLVRERMPNTALVIAADNDQWTKKQDGTPWNTGLRAAECVARDVGGTVVWPEFKDCSTRPTDFNDLHRLEGPAEVRIQAAHRVAGPRITDWGLDLFSGLAPEMRWLVQDTLPLACPCLLAAAGGTGKGMLALDLALRVAGGTTPAKGSTVASKGIDLNTPQDTWLGSPVDEHGSVVILTAEDSRDSIHQRLASIDPDGTRRAKANGRLFIVPLPNAGGPMQLVASAGYNAGYKHTAAFDSIRRQLMRIPNLKLINIDPLASFVGIDINKDPQAGAYIQGLLALLAEETGACVLVAHHMNKSGKSKEKPTVETVRETIRGTTALVDGVRLALAVWSASEASVDEAKKAVGHYMPNEAVFEAAVVKANVRADSRIRVLARAKNGLLEYCDTAGKVAKPSRQTLLSTLVDTVAEAAKDGRPFSKSGSGGFWKRSEELPDALRDLGRNKFGVLLQELLNSERVVACTVGKTQANWLDVPGGDFATGIGTFKAGASLADGGG